MDNNNQQNVPNDVLMIDLSKKRRNLLFSTTIMILSTTSIILNGIDNNLKNNANIFIASCLGTCTIMTGISTITSIIYNRKYIFDIKRRYAPHHMLFEVNNKLTNGILLMYMVIAVLGTISLTMVTDKQKYSNFMIAMLILYIICGYIYGLLIICCMPCKLLVFLFADDENQNENPNAIPHDQNIQNIVNFLNNANAASQNHKIEHVAVGVIDFDVREVECVICYTYKPNAQIDPCKHNPFCSACLTKVKECPMCRGKITTIKICGELILGTNGNATNDANDSSYV